MNRHNDLEIVLNRLKTLEEIVDLLTDYLDLEIRNKTTGQIWLKPQLTIVKDDE